jgi:hypothetical protein
MQGPFLLSFIYGKKSGLFKCRVKFIHHIKHSVNITELGFKNKILDIPNLSIKFYC